MEEIKVGEYVRTEKGSIGKFKSYGIDDVDEKIVYFKNNKGTTCVDENEIVKHSLSIIDLIEVGDYVNGREVKHIAMFEGFPNYPKLIFTDERHLIPGETAENKDIKSIVTREQFSNIEYRLED